MTMTDRITICDLEVQVRIGVPDSERARPQRLLVTVEMESDFGSAAATDDIGATINYQAVATRVMNFGHEREWRLIETLAVELADTILREFRPNRVVIEIKKFILPQARHVSVRAARPVSSLR